MRPLSRSPSSRGAGAGKFRRNIARTKAPNMAPPPMRGGFRL